MQRPLIVIPWHLVRTLEVLLPELNNGCHSAQQVTTKDGNVSPAVDYTVDRHTLDLDPCALRLTTLILNSDRAHACMRLLVGRVEEIQNTTLFFPSSRWTLHAWSLLVGPFFHYSRCGCVCSHGPSDQPCLWEFGFSWNQSSTPGVNRPLAWLQHRWM